MSNKQKLWAACLCLGILTGCTTTQAPSPMGGAPVVTAYWASDDLADDGRYAVVGGDTLYGLAQRFDIPLEDIISYNALQPPYQLQPGQLLYLKPHGTTRAMEDRYQSMPLRSESMAERGLVVESAHPEKAPLLRQVHSALDHVAEHDISWTWPTKQPLSGNFSESHPALDFAGHAGDPIYAVADGEVVYSGNRLRGYGNLLIIKHSKNILSTYAHNRVLTVQEGDRVKKGQKIAEMGQSGTEKVHLHFEMRDKGVPINPQKYLQGR